MHAFHRSRPLPPTLLLKAMRRLLRPLVRLMMQSGVTFPLLADTLRRLFIEVAVNDILVDPNTRTDSRISLLTGVHRKEIKRLQKMPADRAEAPEVVTLASQIIGRWIGTAPFVDTLGRPRPLLRVTPLNAMGDGSSKPSFDSLVASITSDIRPRAVLDDLLSHGVVSMDAEDRIQLNAAAFIPSLGGEEQLFYFARNLHDHVAAAVANIGAAGTARYLDRSVHYDRLSPEQAKALEEFARSAAMRVLLEVNRKAIELTENKAEATVADPRRINFGVYVFGDDDQLAAGGRAMWRLLLKVAAVLLLPVAVAACAMRSPQRENHAGVAVPSAVLASDAICHMGSDGGPLASDAPSRHRVSERLVSDRGIGGTGGPAGEQIVDRGIGGTGAVGVITGLDSICVNGLKVRYDETAAVDVDGTASSAALLRAGQVVVMKAEGAASALQAQTISVRSELTGRMEEGRSASGTRLIGGQPVLIPP